ncbi:E3 ubiquitin-protein ligase APD2 [Coffea arabica]|uniref:E3 ubiquitin-protein ligase APD2 n=1 Tax=Coffea arabica TaxID=13443 RepID=A0A6P6UK73_COFAR|nr:uncharacterized protein LOC113711161 [Coffea arabica]
MDVITGGLTVASSDSVNHEAPSSSSSAHVQEQEENAFLARDRTPNDLEQYHPPHQHRHRPVSYRLNVSVFQVVNASIRDEACAAFIVLVTLWILACLAVILGFYGPSNIELGPNSSRLLDANPFFVQSIKVKELHESKHRPVLYGFNELPPLDVKITWTEAHVAFVEPGNHREWQYFLNKGSKIRVSYCVKSPTGAALSLVIVEGKGNLVDWIGDPSQPTTTLSWNIIHGTGTVEQEILRSKMYYIALGNLNFEEVQVQLNFTIEALTYNTTQANYNCSVSHRPCIWRLFFMGNAAIITTPGPELGMTNYIWHAQVSYGQRWISYFVGSASMTVLLILATKICFSFRITGEYETGFQAGMTASERAPLLSQKDDDLSSWGSVDSMSHDEEELNDSIATPDGKQLKEGDGLKDHRQLCILCSDAFRDCFFLPCGHCAACFTCGKRAMEEAGKCPICRKAMKKVRKIFSV